MKPTESRPATRDGVARAAGVSTTVVSHVFNGRTELVAAATADRVRAVADELGYRPNVLAQALKRGVSPFIGMLTPDVGNSFFAALTRSIEEHAYHSGQLVLVANTNEDPARERHYVDSFVSLRLTALVIVSNARHALSDTALRQLREAGTVIVHVDRVADEADERMVMVDNVGGAAAMTDHLLWHGRRRFVVLAGTEGVSSAEERLRGVQLAIENSRAQASLRVRRGDFSVISGYREARAALSGEHPVDAIVAGSDQQALGALRACRELGVDVPGQVAVTGFDGIPEGEVSFPTLSTVQQPIDAIARAVLEAIGAPAGAAGEQRIPTRVLRRASCGCVDVPLSQQM